jgi:hypothetical protein
VRKGQISRLVVGCSLDRAADGRLAGHCRHSVTAGEAVFRACSAEFNAANFSATTPTTSCSGSTAASRLNGSNAIIDFYRPFHSAVDETVDIEFLVMGDKRAAVEIATEFQARKDC